MSAIQSKAFHPKVKTTDETQNYDRSLDHNLITSADKLLIVLYKVDKKLDILFAGVLYRERQRS